MILSDAPRPRRSPLAAAALTMLVLTVVMTGCGGPAGTGAGERPNGEHRLVEGRGPEGQIPLVADAPVTLNIDSEDWGGTAACNSYGGTVEVTGDELIVQEVFQTEMACVDEQVMASERAYLDAFRQVDRYEQDGDRLVLRGQDVELVFEKLTPEPEVALIDTTWVLTARIERAGPDGAVSSIVGEPTLEFRTDGTFHAATGCNGLSGGYEHDGATLVTRDVVASAAGCLDALEAQEEHIGAVFDGAGVTVSIDGVSLTLMGEDGRGLAYRAASVG
jgi:heat shock protein HslJ